MLWSLTVSLNIHWYLQCENLLEENEAAIEEWYFNEQEKESLKKYLCEERALKAEDSKCLYEQLKGDPGKKESSKEELWLKLSFKTFIFNFTFVFDLIFVEHKTLVYI